SQPVHHPLQGWRVAQHDAEVVAREDMVSTLQLLLEDLRAYRSSGERRSNEDGNAFRLCGELRQICRDLPRPHDPSRLDDPGVLWGVGPQEGDGPPRCTCRCDENSTCRDERSDLDELVEHAAIGCALHRSSRLANHRILNTPPLIAPSGSRSELEID